LHEQPENLEQMVLEEKVSTTIRLDADVLEAMKATGPG
jgi:uncharacterized protein (DUF4415 family)